MNKKKFLFLFSFISIFLSFSLQADTLDVILQSSAHDSDKLFAISAILKDYNSSGQFYKTVLSGEKTLQYFSGLTEDKKSASVINSTIGVAYYYKGDLAKALQYYFKTLKLREELNDLSGTGVVLNNIGVVYQDMKDFPLAKQYLFKALSIRQQISDTFRTAQSQNNIGLLYYSEGSDADSARKELLFDSAMYFFNLSLKMMQSMDKKYDISYTIGNIGNVLKDRKKFQEAEIHYLKSLSMQEELDDKVDMAISQIQLADLYCEMKKFEKSLEFYENAIEICRSMENLDNLKYCYVGMSKVYELQGDSKKALQFFKKFTEIKDSLLNSESKGHIEELQTIYETEKKDSEISILNKKQEVAEMEKKKQAIILYSVGIGLLLVLISSIFIYRSYKQKKLANTRLEKKNSEIIHQKKEIEEKNSEMLASIRYAKRIQQAVLKEEKKVTAYLPDHFVLFKPKDIVSGDFYWAVEKKISIRQSGINPSDQQHWWYVAAADCTGHGVPGAFLTLLGTAYLNEILAEENLYSPAQVLDKLRYKIVKELSQSGKKGETSDGMDISLAAFNLSTCELNWAGANNSFYLIRDEKLVETKADKQPIGFFPNPFPFTNHSFQLKKNDIFYIFSDGYADQFGGPKGKKFKYSQFEQVLVSFSGKPLEEQKQLLNDAIEQWKGDLEQIDDICIIGIRV